MIKVFASILFLLSLYIAKAQEVPPIRNFNPSSYQAGSQNWSISQSDSKHIYVANNEGLLEFNGAKWTLYPSPNETILRSVEVIDDKIFTGCYMEFGFWTRNSKGRLTYTSISENLELALVEDEEFWNILKIDELIIFQSLNSIYIYDPKINTARIIEAAESIVNIYPIAGEVYFQQNNKGLYQIINGESIPIIDGSRFNDDEIISMFLVGEELIILTKNNGFYAYANDQLKVVPSALDSYDNIGIYSAIKLRDRGYALGSIAHGILLLDETLQVKYKVNQNAGLQNNTALCLFEDRDSNLWIGLDNGVSVVNITSPIRVYSDQTGVFGSVYATAIHNGYLYLGTNQGLFCKPISNSSTFDFIEGSQGQVWHLSSINDQLFVGHHNGTFLLKGKKLEQISNIQGTWNIRPLDDKTIIQGNYAGLYALKLDGGKWILSNKLEGFDNSARHFELINTTIIVNHEYKGVYIIKADNSFTKVESIHADTVLKGPNSGLIKYKNDILYASKKGIFKFSPGNGKFSKDSLLSTSYTQTDYVSGKMILNDQKDEFWIFSKSKITNVSSGNLSSGPKIESIPLVLASRRNVVEYENIIPYLIGDQYLIGTSFGYIIIDLAKIKITDFSVQIGTISKGINEDHSVSETLIDIDDQGEFASDENNLNFTFYSPHYLRFFEPTYQYQLLGEYDEWSEWDSESSILFENIPPGKYIFNVRAKIGDTLSKNIASYNFTIAKPWFATNLMLIIYFLIVIAFSIFMHNVYKRYYRKQQRKLIEENQRELKLAKLQNEKQIIKIKNQQLQDDYKNKSNELAASTMSIIKKNELLTQVKEQLIDIRDEPVAKRVVRIIDKSLNQDENWELFKDAFNNADSEFFKNLKILHPKLSPNDLKLCAYLRLNLSSKEVAQLINISPRSVEVKRYRLRKKLNLESDANLTDYILGI
ncbi:MAG: triple tyrosine motif-containing protein [Ekhidna sp.]